MCRILLNILRYHMISKLGNVSLIQKRVFASIIKLCQILRHMWLRNWCIINHFYQVHQMNSWECFPFSYKHCKHQATIDYAALIQATSETVLLGDQCMTFQRCVPVQPCEPLAQWHSVTSHETWIFCHTTRRTSNLTLLK